MTPHASGVVAADRRLTHYDIAALALPITLSNATTPLVGFVDTLVVGQLGVPHLIGGVAIASNIFNAIYWGFGFLRMGTTGLTAQAAGSADATEVAANLARALLVSFMAGGLIILVQLPLWRGALWFMGPSSAVGDAASTYFAYRVWAVPAGLANFALLGWLIGLGRSGLAFQLQIILNGLNIACALLFVLHLEWGVAGVGLAALLSETTAAVIGLLLALGECRRRGLSFSRQATLDVGRLRHMFAISADIMLRTSFALTAFLFFTAQGAQAGDLVLAANAILMAIASVTTYLLDGFAFAAEALVGQAIGAMTRARFREAIRLSTIWAAGFGVGLSALIWLAGPAIIDAMATSPEVRAAARTYLIWAALFPVVGVWCFQLDGIYIGATWTADMRNMMLASLVIYFAAWSVLKPAYANHGLWMALHVFNIARAATLLIRFPALERATFR